MATTGTAASMTGRMPIVPHTPWPATAAHRGLRRLAAGLLRQNGLEIRRILTTQSLSDRCGAFPGAALQTLAKSPPVPVIRTRLVKRARALGRQTAIRAELFPASGLVPMAWTLERAAR